MGNREICQEFANKHKLIFEDSGECGFGRECVGFLSKNGNYVDYNPFGHPSYEQIKELKCEAACPPDEVDAYHKHDCLAVLGHGDEAIRQLAVWVESLESAGDVSIMEYKTGATGMQAMISGYIGYAIKITKQEE